MKRCASPTQAAALADKDATLERERSERAVAEQRVAELERRLKESGDDAAALDFDALIDRIRVVESAADLRPENRP